MTECGLVDECVDYCQFGPERVYLLMAIARAKENEHISSTGEVVFREVVKNELDVGRSIRTLHALGDGYTDDGGEALTFRLYLSVNARNTTKAFFGFQSRTHDWLEQRLGGHEPAVRKCKRLDSHWYSELQRPQSADDSHFLIDIDREYVADVVHPLRDHTKLILTRTTPNGTHAVTKPFNYMETDWLTDDEDVEVKTDDMLFLEML